jgi:hypothetical protein
MESQYPVQKYGTILKREALSNAFVDIDHSFLVLKSFDPFPGFYCPGKNPADNRCKEISYYLPIQVQAGCIEDITCRISLDIFNDSKIQVCASKVLLAGKFVQAIRIKGTNLTGIRRIVSIFNENNIQFYKNKKVNIYLAEIYLKSFFEVKKLEGLIYQNTYTPELFYLDIPEKLDWKLFEKLITYQKTSSTFTNFDAALGYWIGRPVFTDFVRIYGTKLTLTELQTIREGFLENLKNYKDKKILI